MSDLLQIGSPNERPRAPKAEELTLRFGDTTLNELKALLTHYPDKKSAILPGLWMAQREYGGFLSGEAIAEVAHHLGRSYAEVEGVATFYSMYNTAHEVGKHMIEVCTCLTCQICDAYPVAEFLKKKLGIGFGETTADGMFTLHEVECLNACDRAPLIQVGEQYHGPVNESYLDNLIEELKKTDKPSTSQMADSIVQVHLGKVETPWRDWNPKLSETYYEGGESYVPSSNGTKPTTPKAKKAEKPVEVTKVEPVAQAEAIAVPVETQAETSTDLKPTERKRIVADETA